MESRRVSACRDEMQNPSPQTPDVELFPRSRRSEGPTTGCSDGFEEEPLENLFAHPCRQAEVEPLITVPTIKLVEGVVVVWHLITPFRFRGVVAGRPDLDAVRAVGLGCGYRSKSLPGRRELRHGIKSDVRAGPSTHHEVCAAF